MNDLCVLLCCVNLLYRNIGKCAKARFCEIQERDRAKSTAKSLMIRTGSGCMTIRAVNRARGTHSLRDTGENLATNHGETAAKSPKDPRTALAIYSVENCSTNMPELLLRQDAGLTPPRTS
jgi:hypothetical protein